jgi:hypothetical protein
MRPLAAARFLWFACALLFASGIVGLKWGVQLSVVRMPAALRATADIEALHGAWIGRSVGMFLLAAICGIAGIYYSIRASDLAENAR